MTMLQFLWIIISKYLYKSFTKLHMLGNIFLYSCENTAIDYVK